MPWKSFTDNACMMGLIASRVVFSSKIAEKKSERVTGNGLIQTVSSGSSDYFQLFYGSGAILGPLGRPLGPLTLGPLDLGTLGPFDPSLLGRTLMQVAFGNPQVQPKKCLKKIGSCSVPGLFGIHVSIDVHAFASYFPASIFD